MGNVEYTQEQLKVIQTHKRNLLVSAAAGSGKTAVLVERIVQMVTDEKAPLDIDKLLVVTFTNAAAAEMRERISDALEKKLDQNPHLKHLHRQLVLLSNANIMTIHAFCLKVIRNNFNTIGLDPSFKIGDENELLLLKSEVIKELLEEKYAEGDPLFLRFIESYAGSKSDEIIEELIMTTHRFATSNPWPEEWLYKNIENLNVHTNKEFEDTQFYKNLKQIIKETLQTVEGFLLQAQGIIILEDGPIHYKETVEIYLEHLYTLYELLPSGYEAIQKCLLQFEPPKLSQKRTGFDEVLKERAKSAIDKGKELLQELREVYYAYPITDVLSDIFGTYEVLKVLGDLTNEFARNYQKIKEEKNLIDFNDIEHFALDILVQKDPSGETISTEVAKDYRNQFEEILIDEYQDSNLVQETILTSVSREQEGTPNFFMVGDVKQSIYKFRLAKPELFMEKYERYTDEESLYQRINLHKNFRSRVEVVDFINFFFKQAMSVEMGDVTYDDKASLHLGATYDESPLGLNDTEIILVHEIEEEEESELTQREEEAQVIAERIYQLVHEENGPKVFDRKKNSYRKVAYKDIVILLRTLSGWTDVLLEALNQKGIPAYSSTTTGYFETLEISTMMNLFRLIDNPRQDIPLVAVLRSPIVGLKGEELARIRKAFEEGEMYEAMTLFVESAFEEDALCKKLNGFLKELNYFREISKYMPMDELIHQIYDRTHYDQFCMVMPNGHQRKANLDLFVDKAVAYEKSSYRGVFNFIRYVDHIKKFSVDTGEATVFSEGDDLVRIMSIHKSKGLEFPIVFVAALGKKFNTQDLRQSIVFHQDLGIGSDFVHVDERYRVSTLPKMTIKEQLKRELLSEELRILYVALTRAKEKLILVGSVKDLDKKVQLWGESLYNAKLRLSSHSLKSAQCYLDWLMSAVIRHPGCQVLRDSFGWEGATPIAFTDEKSRIKLTTTHWKVQPSEEEGSEASESTNPLMQMDLWLQQALEEDNESANKLSWSYPYDMLIHSKVQMSVSDIKRMARVDEEILTFEKIAIKPKFLGEEVGLTAAEVGTAFHKVMRYIPLSLEPTRSTVEEWLLGLREQKIITEAESERIEVKVIIGFLKSVLCQRMLKADATLRREVPFVLGVPAHEMYQGLGPDTKEMVMVQGVIDAFFEEEGKIILVDYKTDYIGFDQEAILAKRYLEQMTYYKRALEQITQKKVTQVMLYAFHISKTVELLKD